MNKLDLLIRILNGSKRYEFEESDFGGDSVLKLQDYYSGKVVKLDLGKLVEEYSDIVEEIIVEDDEENEDY